MGEVGSGKTVVALYALLRAVEHGYQGALMAPTETLAEQHFATIQRLMPGSVVPGRAADRLDARPAARGPAREARVRRASLIVGTHALIEEAVRFARLGVAVVDEQHRFGVRQRAALDAKASDPAPERPHVLHMTATPIPRTLALAGYGDLDSHAAARASARGAGRSGRSCARAPASGRAPTTGSARSCGPGARRSSSARWSRSPRCSRRARRPRSSSACVTASCGISGSCCSTGRCARRPSRRRWPRSRRGRRTCWSPPR